MFSTWSLIAPGRMSIITLCTVNSSGLRIPIRLIGLQPVVFLIILTYSYSQSQKMCSSWKNKGSSLSMQVDAGRKGTACSACCQTKTSSSFGPGDWVLFSPPGIWPSPFVALPPSQPHSSSVPGLEGTGAQKYAELKDCSFPKCHYSTSNREVDSAERENNLKCKHGFHTVSFAISLSA